MYYLGIESGVRTSIGYLSRDKEKLEYRIEVGPMNHYIYGIEATKNEIKKLLEIALLEADIEINDIKGICFSGSVDSDLDEVLYKEIFRELGYNNYFIACNDSVTRLIAANQEKKGAILLAGSGSILQGYDKKKNLHRVGGWGAKLGDKGSSYSLVKNAIIAIVDAYDFRAEETALTETFLKKFNASSVEEIANYFYSEFITTVELSSHAHEVSELAKNGDKVAKKILNDSYNEQIISIRALSKKMNMDKFSLLLNGSLFVNSPEYLSGLIDVIKKEFPKIKVEHKLVNGAIGAFILASENK